MGSGSMTSVFMPKNSAFEALVRASFARQALMSTLGARLSRVEPGAVDIELGFSPELTQQNGFLHAGVVAVMLSTIIVRPK